MAMKEVKRFAVKGEKIKIVDAVENEDYENGDVFIVIGTSLFKGSVFFVDNEGQTNGAYAREYVVLEP